MACKERHLEVALLGGFGNQLFQLANAVSLSLKFSRIFSFKSPHVGRPTAIDQIGLIPGKYYRAIVAGGVLEVRETESKCQAILRENYVEKTFTHSPIALKNSCGRIKGYFQSYKYFESHDISFRNWLVDKLALEVGSNQENLIGLHARFGDMANDRNFRDYHGVISEDYVFSALAYFNSPVNNLRIVSENRLDLEREMPNILQLKPQIISGNSAIEDFRVLTQFERLIISNSTFSWWAAWCSQGSVIAPKNWFAPKVLIANPINDLIPPTWVLL